MSLTNNDVAQLLDGKEPGDWCLGIGEVHQWAEWELNYNGSCEYRLCAKCGGMEQQWIS